MNYYARAIQILKELDHTEVLYKVAARNPGVIVSAVDGSKLFNGQLEAECKKLLKNKKKMDAIRLWRDKKNVTFEEAREAVGGFDLL